MKPAQVYVSNNEVHYSSAYRLSFLVYTIKHWNASASSYPNSIQHLQRKRRNVGSDYYSHLLIQPKSNAIIVLNLSLFTPSWSNGIKKKMSICMLSLHKMNSCSPLPLLSIPVSRSVTKNIFARKSNKLWFRTQYSRLATLKKMFKHSRIRCWGVSKYTLIFLFYS